LGSIWNLWAKAQVTGDFKGRKLPHSIEASLNTEIGLDPSIFKCHRAQLNLILAGLYGFVVFFKTRELELSPLY
jgi:hypothetical protein